MLPFALGFIIEPLRRYAQPLLAAGAIAFLVAAGVQSVRLGYAQRTVAQLEAKVAQLRADYDAERSKAAAERAAMLEEYRSKEAAWSAEKEKANAEYQRNLQAERARAAALARDNQQLRQLAEAYARGPAAPADDSVAACRQRAAALGELFAEADREAGDMAQSADRHADEVRLCLAAWPR
jgi:septal ring factor EnvC (AmiA/AmiB activator)